MEWTYRDAIRLDRTNRTSKLGNIACRSGDHIASPAGAISAVPAPPYHGGDRERHRDEPRGLNADGRQRETAGTAVSQQRWP